MPIWTTVLVLLLAYNTPAWAITNGSADVSWDNSLDAGATVDLQYASFKNSTWQALTAGPPAIGADGKWHTTATWPAAPADNDPDHWICVQARSNLNGQQSAWTESACNQIPVPKLGPRIPRNFKIQ